MASQKIAEMDADLVIAGLAQHVRVFDCAVVTPYRTTDGGQSTGIRALDHAGFVELTEGIEVGHSMDSARRSLRDELYHCYITVSSVTVRDRMHISEDSIPVTASEWYLHGYLPAKEIWNV